VELPDGQVVVAHCPNPGSMKTCLFPGSTVYLSAATNPKRKLKWTWELAQHPGGSLILINTSRPNSIVEEAINNGVISQLPLNGHLRREVRYGEQNSRVDLVITSPQSQCWIEVKSVTMLDKPGVCAFPDSVTTRGTKHLRELMSCVKQGDRAVLLFVVNREGIETMCPADDIDPVYGATLREAIANGVEIIAYKTNISTQHVEIANEIPVVYG